MFEPSQLNQSTVSLAMQRACSDALGVARARMAARAEAQALGSVAEQARKKRSRPGL